MKTICFVPLIAFAAWCGSVPSPAELAIQSAQVEIAQHPDYFPGYNHLAMAYARRVRETGDVSFYKKAEDTVKKSFALLPDNYDGRKTQVFILLGKGEYPAALDAAKKLNRQTPDDVSIYGYIADAEIELGEYQKAIEATQWMINLRPGNAPALIRAGRLRELYKDWNGALQVLQMAYEATPFAEREDRAWLLVRMGRVDLESGDPKSAEAAANDALGLFPQYGLALDVLNDAHAAEKR